MTQHSLLLTEAPVPVPPTGTTEVRLEGGPASIPRRLVVPLADAVYGKIKVPHLAGYEHFVRTAENTATNLFSWESRTSIAE